ncbi:MAG: hypothetical protein V2J20_08680 [Wenzhouxiangella sp.]|nr:hypothetical protein [Wenzhouxiangella sp.]
MIGRATLIGLLVLALVAGSNFALANNDRQTTGDILLIEKVFERMTRDLPGNGLSMAEVEQRFGSPNERSAAVGEPPITRWTYGDYSVYFEHNLVIESVLHHEAVIREVANTQN